MKHEPVIKIRKVCSGDSESKMISSSGFTRSIIPEDGIVITMNCGGVLSSCYLRNSDLENVKTSNDSEVVAISWGK